MRRRNMRRRGMMAAESGGEFRPNTL